MFFQFFCPFLLDHYTAFAEDYTLDPTYGVSINEIAVAGSDIGKSPEKPASVITGSFMRETLMNSPNSPVAPIYIKSTKAILTIAAISEYMNVWPRPHVVTFIAPNYTVTVDTLDMIYAAEAGKDIDLSFYFYVTKAGIYLNYTLLPEGSYVFLTSANESSSKLSIGAQFNENIFNGLDTSNMRLYLTTESGAVLDRGPLSLDGINVSNNYVISPTPLTVKFADQINATTTTAAVINTTSATVPTTQTTTFLTAPSTQTATPVADPSTQTVTSAAVAFTEANAVVSKSIDESRNLESDGTNVIAMIIIILIVVVSGIGVIIFKKVK